MEWVDVCSSVELPEGGSKVMLDDAAEAGLIAHFTFDDALGL